MNDKELLKARPDHPEPAIQSRRIFGVCGCELKINAVCASLDVAHQLTLLVVTPRDFFRQPNLAAVFTRGYVSRRNPNAMFPWPGTSYVSRIHQLILTLFVRTPAR